MSSGQKVWVFEGEGAWAGFLLFVLWPVALVVGMVGLMILDAATSN